jgi:hypothetical protein
MVWHCNDTALPFLRCSWYGPFVFSSGYWIALPHKTYELRPAPRVISELSERIVATGYPEAVTDLHPGPIGADEPFLKLLKITVSDKLRTDGTMMPCPRCTPNRFWEGWLIYLSDLQAIAFVGNKCAGSVALAEADLEWNLRQARETEEEYLLTTLPTIRALLVTVEQLEARCVAASELHKTLRNDAKEAFGALRVVAKQSGLLTVDEIMSKPSGGPAGLGTRGSTVETRSLSFGRLSGSSAFIGAFDPHKTILEAAAVLKLYRCDTDGEVLETISSLSDMQRSAVCKQMRKAIDAVGAVSSNVDDFAEFFADTNLGRVSDWGAHRDAPVHLTVMKRALGGGLFQLEFRYPGNFGRIAIPAGLLN